MPRRRFWDPRRLPDLAGRRYLVTGATSGIGFFSTLQLASAGAHVIMTGRNPHRLQRAKAAVLDQHPDASLETLLLDTSNHGSVRAAAATARGRKGLDGLLLNAGIVHPPRSREVAVDGHELVLATNVLGHFSLAAELLPTLAASDGRMVWLGSISTGMWQYDPVDPELVDDYSPWRAYVQSKVMCTALGLEADRRLADAGVPVRSVVAHPGFSISGRTRTVPGINEPTRATRFGDNLLAAFAQSKETGAQSIVRALAGPGVRGGDFWGPAVFLRGEPRTTRAAKIARDPERGARLWEFCEQATRTTWPFAKAARPRRRFFG